MPKRRPAKIVDARAAERSAVQASLAAAEAISAAILHKKTKKIGSQDSVTNEDVVEALRAMNVRASALCFSSISPNAHFFCTLIVSLDSGGRCTRQDDKGGTYT